MISTTDTIVALATPMGRGGIGVIRVSGSLSTAVALALLGKVPRPRRAEYLPFLDHNGDSLDQGIALFFPGPKSFTGEDVLELQGHGGPVILNLLLQRILSIQEEIRIAKPGEFSERAFINTKIDLVQAEAIADLINASSVQAARSAMQSLQGHFSIRIHELVKDIADMRVDIEASIDFPEETHGVSVEKVKIQLKQVISNLNKIRIEARRGSVLREGMKVVIIGQPNVGKSTLLNSLAGREVAIVTDIAGTTRDILHEHIHLDDISLHIIDTAGLHTTTDAIELIGIERAWCAIQETDHILLIIDGVSTPLGIGPNRLCPDVVARLPKGVPVTVIRSKSDITGEKVGVTSIDDYVMITLSAQSGIGMDLLRTQLKKTAGFISNEGSILARQRHLDALKSAEIHLKNGKEKLDNHETASYVGEFLAEELRLAQKALSNITGTFSSDDLLGIIFSNFCIGK